MDTTKITEEEIKETLGRSGYFLETRVLGVLQAAKYVNSPNSTYPDANTDKSREIDIYSTSPRAVENLSLNEMLHIEIQHKLIIECINNLQPLIFFKRPDSSQRTIFGKFRYNKVERDVVQEPGRIDPDHEFHTFTTRSKRFHYNQIKANTQYCSFTAKKSKEWMASHTDSLHDTFNKLYDFTAHSERRLEKWIPISMFRDGVFNVIHYPVLVLQNDLYEAFEIDGEISLEKKDHLVYEFNRYDNGENTLLIDVIAESYLEKFLEILADDMKGIRNTYSKFYKNKTIVEADRTPINRQE